MTAPVARYATAADHDLLDDYVAFCRELAVSDRALRDRLRAARGFLAAHPDLGVWMRRPVQARLTDLRRIKAWPLVGWAVLSGHVTTDLELLLVKDFGTLGTAAEQLFPGDFADAHAAAARLGWSPTWARSIVREALVLTIAATGRTLRQLTADDLDDLGRAIAACPLITDAARKRHRARSCSGSPSCCSSVASSTRHRPAATHRPRASNNASPPRCPTRRSARR